MKLKNKHTGKVNNYILTVTGTNILDTVHFESIEALLEQFEDYKPKLYRLKFDLPTFKKGDTFEIGADGCLYLYNNVDFEPHWKRPLMAYHKKTLENFPNILEDWFEPLQ